MRMTKAGFPDKRCKVSNPKIAAKRSAAQKAASEAEMARAMADIAAGRRAFYMGFEMVHVEPEMNP